MRIPKSWQFTKKEKVDLMIVIIMFGFAYVGLGYLLGYFDKQYTYTFELTAVDRTNRTILYDSGIAMTAKAFAAHEPIHVNVVVLAYNNQTNIVLNPNSVVTPERNLTSIYIIFPRSHKLPLTPTNTLPNVFYGALVNATWNANDRLYHGEIDMVYEMQGFYILGVQSKPYDIIENQTSLAVNTLINISSDDVSTALIANRTLISLGYLAASIGVLTARPLFLEYFARERTDENWRY